MKKFYMTEEIYEFIKSSLLKDYPEMDLNQFKIDTDLSEFGIESIKVLTILSEIESKFKLSLSLDNLEACNFKISAVTIAESFND